MLLHKENMSAEGTGVAPRYAELGHVVRYGEGGESGDRVAGVLEDYVFTGHAALDAWEVTGEMRYFEAALGLGKAADAKFYDPEAGGFFDTERLSEGETRLGVLITRRKPLQDSPSPGGNAVAAALLLRLAELTGNEEFRGKAKATLECFAGVVEHFRIALRDVRAGVAQDGFYADPDCGGGRGWVGGSTGEHGAERLRGKQERGAVAPGWAATAGVGRDDSESAAEGREFRSGLQRV